MNSIPDLTEEKTNEDLNYSDLFFPSGGAQMIIPGIGPIYWKKLSDYNLVDLQYNSE
jgi:hypothetical protein